MRNNFGKTILLIGLLITAVFLVTLKGVNRNIYPQDYGVTLEKNKPPFETSMERGRYAHTVAIFENQSFTVDEFYKFLEPDLAWHNGHYFPSFPPVVSIFSVPFYGVGKMLGMNQVGVFAASAAATVATVLMLIQILLKLGMRRVGIVFASLAYALGTSAFAYSVSTSAHSWSALMVTMAMYIILLTRAESSWFQHSLFYVVYGLAILIDYPNAIIMLPLLIVFVLQNLKMIKTEDSYRVQLPVKAVTGILGILVVLIPYAYYSWYYYQKPFVFTNTYNLKIRGTAGQPIDFDNPENMQMVNDYGRRFEIEKIPFGVGVLLTSQDRGLIYFSPIFLAAIPGLLFLWKKDKRSVAAVLGTFVMTTIFYAAYDDPWGGWSFGPRYLIPALPLLAIPVAEAVEKARKKNVILLVLAFGILILTIAINLLGALSTNAVPPSVEAIHFGVDSNITFNINWLKNGLPGSVLYNSLLIDKISPTGFYWLLLGVITVISGGMIFWKEKKEYVNG